MACYCGITTNLERRKEEHKRDYLNLHDWTQQSFPSREAAQNWENQQDNCHHHSGGQDPDNPHATWYGYKFYY